MLTKELDTFVKMLYVAFNFLCGTFLLFNF